MWSWSGRATGDLPRRRRRIAQPVSAMGNARASTGAASAMLGAVGLTLFGHGRVLAVTVVVAALLSSTVAADLLQHGGWRVPAPFLRRLLAEPGNR